MQKVCPPDTVVGKQKLDRLRPGSAHYQIETEDKNETVLIRE